MATDDSAAYRHCGCRNGCGRVLRSPAGRSVHERACRGEAVVVPVNPPRPVAERFWARVTPTTDGSCWIWQGRPSSTGYGKLGAENNRGSMLYAHRVSYEIHNGPIPDGLQIDHLCRVPMCVNPDHLEAVTPAVNTMRARPFRTKQQRRRTHCQRGHSLHDAVVVKRSEGRQQRLCRTCEAARRRCRSGHTYSLDAARDRGGRRICDTCIAIKAAS